MPGTPTRSPLQGRGPVFPKRARGSMSRKDLDTPSFSQRLYVAAMWVFLGPLIIVLGTADVLTRGRTRNWP